MAMLLADYMKTHTQKADIKVAFFDIDGTLLGLDGNYSLRVKNSIARIQSLGVKTAIASGRPYFATEFLWRELGLTDAGVYCTGAQVFSPKRLQTLRTHYLPEVTLRRLIARLREANIYYELYTDKGFFIERNKAPDILRVHAQHLRVQPTVTSFDAVKDGVIKLLIGVNLQIDSTVLQVIESEFPECIFAYACLPAYPEWSFASIVDHTASKQKAFEYLLEYYQVEAANVMSFGDAQSDKTFLTLAGIGVAMGNASEAVKTVADVETLAVWDDGVACALDALVC